MCVSGRLWMWYLVHVHVRCESVPWVWFYCNSWWNIFLGEEIGSYGKAFHKESCKGQLGHIQKELVKPFNQQATRSDYRKVKFHYDLSSSPLFFRLEWQSWINVILPKNINGHEHRLRFSGQLIGCGKKSKIMRKFWAILCRKKVTIMRKRRQIMWKFLTLIKLFPWLFQTYKIHVNVFLKI